MSEKSRTKISKAKSKNILGSWTQFMWEGHDSQHFVVKVLFAEYVNVFVNQQNKGPKYKRAKSEQKYCIVVQNGHRPAHSGRAGGSHACALVIHRALFS